MKIAIYSDWFTDDSRYGSGADVYTINLISILAKYNKITVFTNKFKDTNIDFNEVLNFYKIPESIQKKIIVKYAPSVGWDYDNRLKNEMHVHLFLKKRIRNFDLFINCSESTMHGFSKCYPKIPSIKIVHFPWKKKSLDSKLPFIKMRLQKYYNSFEQSYDLFLANSKFTETEVLKVWNNPNTKALYPPVNWNHISESEIYKKKNIILCVSRIVQDKKIFELAQCFKQIAKNFGDWQFVIAGNILPGDYDYANKISKTLNGTNHKIFTNVDIKKLRQLYKNSKIFWAAKGLDEIEPEKMEHFGMTTVEAMASGCVPVVINKGGQPEIVDSSCGYRWDNINELKDYTINLMEDANLYYRFSAAAIKKSQKFLMPSFEKNFTAILKDKLGLRIK